MSFFTKTLTGFRENNTTLIIMMICVYKQLFESVTRNSLEVREHTHVSWLRCITLRENTRYVGSLNMKLQNTRKADVT